MLRERKIGVLSCIPLWSVETIDQLMLILSQLLLVEVQKNLVQVLGELMLMSGWAARFTLSIYHCVQQRRMASSFHLYSLVFMKALYAHISTSNQS